MAVKHSLWWDFYWQAELIQLRDRFLGGCHDMAKNHRKLGENAFGRVETTLILAAIIIRRMIESKVIPDSLAEKTYELTKIPRIAGTLKYQQSRMDTGSAFDANFDIGEANESRIRVWDIVCKIIHAKYLLYDQDQSGIISKIVVASDRSEKDGEFAIAFDPASWREVLEDFITSELSAGSASLDQKTNKLTETRE